jgi:hypothetical protein
MHQHHLRQLLQGFGLNRLHRHHLHLVLLLWHQ